MSNPSKVDPLKCFWADTNDDFFHAAQEELTRSVEVDSEINLPDLRDGLESEVALLSSDVEMVTYKRFSNTVNKKRRTAQHLRNETKLSFYNLEPDMIRRPSSLVSQRICKYLSPLS